MTNIFLLRHLLLRIDASPQEACLPRVYFVLRLRGQLQLFEVFVHISET